VGVKVTTDGPEILGRIEPVLIADPVRNTVFAGVREALRADAEAGWCAYNSVALAARSSPAHPIALTEGWTDLPALAAALRELPDLTELGGPVAVVETLLAELGRAPVAVRRERLYQLEAPAALQTPTDVAGGARVATTAELDLVARWADAFRAEAHGDGAHFDATRWAARAIVHSSVWLWLDRDRGPVSMAARRAPAAGVARVGPVYTPPPLRRHGYASAVTARATFDVLDQAAVAVLYTDLDNPTSNDIYRALGYRPVTDRLSVSFR